MYTFVWLILNIRTRHNIICILSTRIANAIQGFDVTGNTFTSDFQPSIAHKCIIYI